MCGKSGCTSHILQVYTSFSRDICRWNDELDMHYNVRDVRLQWTRDHLTMRSHQPQHQSACLGSNSCLLSIDSYIITSVLSTHGTDHTNLWTQISFLSKLHTSSYMMASCMVVMLWCWQKSVQTHISTFQNTQNRVYKRHHQHILPWRYHRDKLKSLPADTVAAGCLPVSLIVSFINLI